MGRVLAGSSWPPRAAVSPIVMRRTAHQNDGGRDENASVLARPQFPLIFTARCPLLFSIMNGLAESPGSLPGNESILPKMILVAGAGVGYRFTPRVQFLRGGLFVEGKITAQCPATDYRDFDHGAAIDSGICGNNNFQSKLSPSVACHDRRCWGSNFSASHS
jgi:hypothetical protein